MSQRARDDILETCHGRRVFRALLARDPETALAEYDLTPEQRALFPTTTARAERLEDRISKTGLAAGMSVKTSSPLLKAPSEAARKR